MKQLIILFFASLTLAACSTTNSSSSFSEQTTADSTEQQVCFYTKKPGWHFKEKHCVSPEAYVANRPSFMPAKAQAQYNHPISVDKLPNSSK